MNLRRELIGHVKNIPIHHGIATFDFEDYDIIFQTLKNIKPRSYHHYGEPYMKGLILYCGDEYKEERISFKDLNRLIMDNWSILKTKLKCNKDLNDCTETLHHYTKDEYGNSVRGESYETLSLKYTSLSFQVTDCGLCPFDRVSEKVSMYDWQHAQKIISKLNST